MSWTCPDELNRHCKRLRKLCQPGIKGCILKDKVKFLDLGREDLSATEVNLKNKTRD